MNYKTLGLRSASFVVTSILVCMMLITPLSAQVSTSDKKEDEKKILNEKFESLDHRLDVLEKAVDDVLWYQKVGDVAIIDKIYQVGPPPAKVPNPTAMGATNPVKFWSYIFIPQKIDRAKKYPLLVFPHGGVHSNFSTYYTHVMRELMAQGYVVIAPEYRGSTGYGKDLYEQIDYGGLEIEDVHASRNYMLENYDFVDDDRVGIIGWSHGGLITLMNIFEHPKDYKVAFAGVPVSDLVARMGYQTEDYRKEYSAEYHIGKRRTTTWKSIAAAPP